jgi:hypothetical protein
LTRGKNERERDDRNGGGKEMARFNEKLTSFRDVEGD